MTPEIRSYIQFCAAFAWVNGDERLGRMAYAITEWLDAQPVPDNAMAAALIEGWIAQDAIPHTAPTFADQEGTP